MAKKLWYKVTKSHVVRFLLSAGAGFAVDIAAFYLLYHNLFEQKTYGLLSYTIRNSTLSLSISFFLGVMVNFIMTRYLVFNQSKLPAYKQFIRFISVAVIGFFANLIVLKFMIQQLNIYPPLARIFTALSLFSVSYFIHKLFSFNLSLRQQQHEIKPDHKSGN
jgi:putative flippase GtrA